MDEVATTSTTLCTTSSTTPATTNGNASLLYFVTPHPDPQIAACAKMALHSELQTLLAWKFWVNGVITLVVALFGLTGNALATWVLSQPKMRNSFNQLLVALCISDSIFIACNLCNSAPSLGIKDPTLDALEQYTNVLAQVSLCSSVFMIVAFTLERHFAIRSPHLYRIHIRTTPRWRHLALYIGPVTILSLILNIPMFLNLKRSFMTDPVYVKVNLWLRIFHPLMTTGLAPLVVLAILNARICQGIVQLHHRRTNRNAKEISLTYIAIAIVALFVLFNLPRIAAGFHEVLVTSQIIFCIEHGVRYIPSLTFYQVDAVARLLMIVNSSVNFIVYCGGSSAFQDVFCRQFLPNCSRREGAAEEEEDEDEDEVQQTRESQETREALVVRTRINNDQHTNDVETVLDAGEDAIATAEQTDSRLGKRAAADV